MKGKLDAAKTHVSTRVKCKGDTAFAKGKVRVLAALGRIRHAAPSDSKPNAARVARIVQARAETAGLDPAHGCSVPTCAMPGCSTGTRVIRSCDEAPHIGGKPRRGIETEDGCS